MALTEITYTGTGGVAFGPIPFPYLEESDVLITINGAATSAFTIDNSTKIITFSSAPAIGSTIRVYRNTDNDTLAATFVSGSAIRAVDLNDNFTQNLYVIQELDNNSVQTDGSNTMVGDLDMGGYEVINVGTPTSDGAAVNKQYVDSRLGGLDIPGFTRWTYNATGGETDLSGAGSTGGTLAYSAGREQVFLNGAQQQRGVDYTADNGTNVEFAVALTAGDVVEVICVNNLNTGTTAQAQDVSFVQSGAGAITRSVENKLRDVVSVKDFGAVGDGVTDDTAAIQAAFNYAYSNLNLLRKVFIPSGSYLVSTLYVPVGIQIEGEAFSETTARTGTKLIQSTASDVIRFIPQDSGGKNYWFGTIRNLAIFGNSALASGWGISFKDSSSATVSMQDLSCLEDIVIRRCPSGGIEIPNSGLPITLQRIKLLFNNGPGIHLTSVTTNQHQAVNFLDISGDGNNGGLIKLSGLDRSGNVNIYNLKSECRINSDYSNTELQQNAIVMDSCSGTPINVFGATHICSIPDGANFKKPGSLIKLLDANFPEIVWSGVAVRVRVGDTGTDPSIVEYSTTIAIPYTNTSGRFGNSNFSHVTQASGYKQTFGPVNSYQADGAEDTAIQIAGTTPAYSLYEIDGADDSKAWVLAASSGQCSLRANNDDGTLGQIIWAATRNRFDIGPDSSGTYLRVNGTSTTSAVAGAASALPVSPVGYITININGVDSKIPYYS